MSWSISATGTRDEVIEQIEKNFEPLIKANTDEPWVSEYKGARDGLVTLVKSLPAGAKYALQASGHVYDWMAGEKRSVGGQIEIKLTTAQ